VPNLSAWLALGDLTAGARLILVALIYERAFVAAASLPIYGAEWHCLQTRHGELRAQKSTGYVWSQCSTFGFANRGDGTLRLLLLPIRLLARAGGTGGCPLFHIPHAQDNL